MTSKVISVGEDALVADIARTLLEHRIGAVPVLDADGRPVGIVSEGDLVRRPESRTDSRGGAWWLAWLCSPEERAAEYAKSHGRRARDVMTQPVVTVEESAPLEQVADLLERRRIKRVPVVSDGRLVGILSRANLLHGLATARPGATLTSDDETIRASVLETLRETAGVRDELMNVVVANGTVHLWGAVHSEAERRAARVAAESTIGVRAVTDHLGVLPPQLRSGLAPE